MKIEGHREKYEKCPECKTELREYVLNGTFSDGYKEWVAGHYCNCPGSLLKAVKMAYEMNKTE